MKPSEPMMHGDGGQTSPGSRRGRGRPPLHGLVTLKRTVRQLGGRVIDRRTTLGRALAAWRADLIRDLGGEVSTQQAAIIDLAVKTKLMLDSIDAWLLTQPSLVLRRKRALLPVVRERMQLSDGLARYLGQLGLERKSRELDVAAALAALHRRDTGREENPETRDTRKPERERGPGDTSSRADFEQSNGIAPGAQPFVGGAPVGEAVRSPNDRGLPQQPVVDAVTDGGAAGG